MLIVQATDPDSRDDAKRMATPPPALAIQLLRGVRFALYLVTAGAAAATLAGWTSRWWLGGELASHFRVQYFWICLACAISLAIAGQWPAAGLAALLVVLNLSVIAPLYLPVTTIASANPPLRIASINVNSGNRRHADVHKFITTTQPDVVLLLEVTSAWHDLFEDLTADYPYQETELREDNFGIGLVSRVPLESLEVREIGPAELPSIVAQLRWQDAPLTIIGTHPLPPGNRELWRLRNDQFAALAALCRAQNDAVVVIGDLNTTSWSAHFGTLLDGTRLRDSRTGFGVQPSWPAWSPLPRIPIDHCLVSPEIVVRNRFIGVDVGSDHYPLMVDLEIVAGASIAK
jgi:endonuclease/exonuclease/phosphatase (EEP) superfamily protein YafD